MPEILTESFCERCGTRYTFESAAPRAARLSGIKVLSRGLKNFVMSDDTSMDEAMAAARSETDREVTSQQLDAFHKTFNFCMTCRQYTCGNCWNDAEGRCLTCAPHLGHEIMPAPFPDLPSNGIATAEPNGRNGHAPEAAALSASSEALAWPTMDLDRVADDEPETIDEGEPIEPIDAVARLAFLGATDAAVDEAREDEPAQGTEAAAIDEVEAAAIADVVDEPDVVAAPEANDAPEVAAAEPAAAVEPELRAAAAASATNELMQRFRPGQSLDDEIAAYERDQAVQDAAAAATGALAVGAIADAPDDDPHHATVLDVAAATTAALAAGAAHDHDEHVEAPAVEIPAVEPDIPAVAATRDDVVEQPTWQIVAPDPGVASVPIPSAPADPAAPSPTASAEPQWPSQPEWPSHRPAGGLPYLNRPAQPSGGIDALWAESAREVASPTAPGATAKAASGVQPCVSCGLSLSANARFCRRCGSRQG